MLSVVLITKNEEERILKCVKSVQKALDNIKELNSEIIIVDSNSNDRTIEKIINENVKIILLKKENKYMTAAMGRYIGAKNAKYDNILFLDADMLLDQYWLKKAFYYLNEYDGIIGEIEDYDEVNENKLLRKSRYGINKIRECRHFGGALLIKREVLLSVGNYNPYIKTNEENELFARILRDNYKIVEIPDRMAKHFTPEFNIFDKISNILKNDMKLGRALAFKYSVKDKSVKEFIKLKREFYITVLIDIICISLILANKIKCSISIQGMLIIFYIMNNKFKDYIIDKIWAIKFIIGLLYRNKEFNIEYEIVKEI